jgi:SAM-dependent methyltransferase
MLHLYLRERTQFFSDPVRVLDVAPTPCFRALAMALPQVDYTGMDLSTRRTPDVVTDLTSAGLRAESFDLVICFHVLEHIPDDAAALTEMRRVLRPDGHLILQVPLPRKETLEDPSASIADRVRLFGQDDHVRAYGMDIVDRLARAGFSVDVQRPLGWQTEDVDRYALHGDDQVIFDCAPVGQRAEADA